MRATLVACGIKGIFPLIKKYAPSAITTLPSLRSLPQSTRLAIDATLLIQRLHFADDAHPSRHLIGFHRLIRQIRECSLVPIMIFDNFDLGAKLPAKKRENEKRRAKRSKLIVRAQMERMRGERLEALAYVLKEWKEMRVEDRAKAADLLHTWKREDDSRRSVDLQAPSPFDVDDVDGFDELLELIEEGLIPEVDPMTMISEAKSLTIASSWDHQPPLEDRSDFLMDTLSRRDLMPSIPQSAASMESADIWSSIQEAESSSVLAVASRIHRLRRQYGSMLLPSQKSPQDEDKPHTLPPETPAQVEMTLVEGSLYHRLQAGVPDPGEDLNLLVGTSRAEAASIETQHAVSDVLDAKEDEEQPDQLLAQAAAKNMTMQRSYVRHSTPLSRDIFEACATLCSILKVPVLWTGDGSRSGGRAHEAEALAAMLVRSDLADVVVSEDSDVLLYGAPLLRGVMGHKSLEYIDSTRVRMTLFPPSPELPEEKGEEESKKQMLDFALLCGTDFNRTVPGIGSITALKLVREYKSIRGIRLESLRRRVEKRADQVTKVTKEKMKGGSAKGLQFPMPDNLRWRDYSKELNEARRVFENPPSPKWEAHKLRSSRTDEESIDYAALSVFLRDNEVPPREQGQVSSPTEKLSARQRQSQVDDMPSPAVPRGFGDSPFADGKGSVASWSGSV